MFSRIPACQSQIGSEPTCIQRQGVPQYLLWTYPGGSGMQVGESGLLINDKSGASAEFSFTSSMSLHRTSWLLFWAKLRLTVGDGVVYEVPGLSKAATSNFIKTAEKAWRDYLKNPRRPS